MKKNKYIPKKDSIFSESVKKLSGAALDKFINRVSRENPQYTKGAILADYSRKIYESLPQAQSTGEGFKRSYIRSKDVSAIIPNEAKDKPLQGLELDKLAKKLSKKTGFTPEKIKEVYRKDLKNEIKKSISDKGSAKQAQKTAEKAGKKPKTVSIPNEDVLGLKKTPLPYFGAIDTLQSLINFKGEIHFFENGVKTHAFKNGVEFDTFYTELVRTLNKIYLAQRNAKKKIDYAVISTNWNTDYESPILEIELNE